MTAPGNDSALIVDPGTPGIARYRQILEHRAGGIALIVLTHEHFDHIAGVEALRCEYDCPVICSLDCSKAIADPKMNLSRYSENHLDITCRAADFLIEDHLTWLWKDIDVRFFPTPGHSPGSICVAVGNYLFTGDTLLPGAKGVTHLPGGSRAQWQASLRTIRAEFTPETIVFPGHGDPFCLEGVSSLIEAELAKECGPLRASR